MDSQSTQNSSLNQPTSGSSGQIKVDIFSLDKDLKGLTDKLKNDREALTKTFDQVRNAIRLLADLVSETKGEGSPAVDLSQFELAGVDVAQVLKDKINEQASFIDKLANERNIKSNLAEQFTHYDDRHTGAEAKNELLEDVETQLMSTIYNQINELRGKIESSGVNQNTTSTSAQPTMPQNNNQFTIDSQTPGNK